jgi:hypothetical protein
VRFVDRDFTRISWHLGGSAGNDRSAGTTATGNNDYSIDFHRAMPQNKAIGAGTVARFAAAKKGS